MNRKGHAVATEPSTEGVSTEEPETPPVDDGGDAGAPPDGDQGTEQETFPREYVEKLREEAAAHRTKAKRAEDAETLLRTLAIADATRGLLTDPTDLQWSDDLAGDDGWPAPEKITAAAEALVSTKPHLGRPSGDIGQGRHSETDDGVSLAALLKAGA